MPMLSLNNKRWLLSESSVKTVESLVGELGESRLFSKLLVNRNVISSENARFILDSSLDKLPDPFQMTGMSKAAERIVRAIENDERITIFADYDVDGVTSAAFMIYFFRDIGYPISHYLPDRMKEGYGISDQALEKILSEGGGLIITADCGITAIKETERAREMGMDIIVSDHHQVGPEGLPKAVAVLNPHQPDCLYPYRFLSGVGIVLKLATAVRSVLYKKGWDKEKLPNLRKLLDLFALGTIADVAPLTEENHVLTRHGLVELAQSAKPGLVALKSVAGVNGSVDARAVGFSLGPRLNAAGRLGKADTGLDLLVSKDLEEAMELAQQLDKVNRERQEVQKWTLKEALHKVEQEVDLNSDRVIVLASENFHRGVVGIVAAKLVDKYYRPALLLTLSEKGASGSGRSIPKFNLFKAISECAGELTQFGGHAYAAGVALDKDRVDVFRKHMNEIGKRILSADDLIPEIWADAELRLETVNRKQYKSIQRLEPFGAGNPVPLFISRRVEVRGIRYTGKGKNHAYFKARQGGVYHNVIAFNMGDVFKLHINEGAHVDILYEIQVRSWNGRDSLQLNLRDVRLAN
tara:strand:+ start:583 stop:2325 length:1743 start_codon:yes stop_codon:yes gene_type:complete